MAQRLPPRAGIGLKFEQAPQWLAQPPDIGFVEVHAENCMVDGGPVHHLLERVRAERPLTLHGVGLSIGGPGPLDEAHLARLAALVRRYQPAQVSEHLAWSSHGGAFFNDLLPLPLNAATLARVCTHIDQVQARLGRQMLLENPSTYLAFEASTMDEDAFLAEVLRRTGCGLLLDLNNLHVSCTNQGRDAMRALDRLPLAGVRQLHLAGFTATADSLGAPLLIDSHGSPVDAAVWALFEAVVQRLGPLPTLLERDQDLPPLAALVAEAAQAEQRMAAASAPARCAA